MRDQTLVTPYLPGSGRAPFESQRCRSSTPGARSGCRHGARWIASRPPLTLISDTSPTRNDPSRVPYPARSGVVPRDHWAPHDSREKSGGPSLGGHRCWSVIVGRRSFGPGAPVPTGSLQPKPVDAESLLDRMTHTTCTVPTDATPVPRRPRPWTRAGPRDRRVDTWVLMRARGLSGCSS